VDLWIAQLTALTQSTITASLTPAVMAFGIQNINTTSGVQFATFTNTGSVPVNVTSVTVTGNFTRTGGTCVGGTFTVAVGASCTIGITFTPTAQTSYTGTLAITSNASGSPQISNLTGQGVAPAIQWTPTTYNFGNVIIGNSVNSISLQLKNTGTGPLLVVLTFTGANPAQFSIFSNGCPSPLAPGASCNVVVKFTPSAVASYSANLVETDSSQSISASVALSGAGVARPPTAPWTPMLL
jgi:hypothetical protein